MLLGDVTAPVMTADEWVAEANAALLGGHMGVVIGGHMGSSGEWCVW